MVRLVVLGVFIFSCAVVSLAFQPPFYPYSYCQAPNTVSPTSSNYKLELVQTITRHGDRTTIAPLPGQLPFFCKLTTLMLPSMDNAHTASVPRLYRKNYLPNREILPGNCNFGQLTPKGFKQHVDLGSNLRDLYVDKYQFLSGTLNTSEIWVRSTDVYRTVQSVQANLLGLFPSNPVSGQNIPVVDMYTMDNAVENMYANPTICPRYVQVLKQVSSEPEIVDFEKSTTPLKIQLAKIFDVTVENLPPWGDLFDGFNVLNCYNLSLPSGVTQDQVNQVYQFANWEYNYTLANTELTKLTIGSFLGELVERIQDKISGDLIPKYLHYSGHDTTIAPLTTALGAYDGRWPPYASHVQLELYSDAKKSYYVQVKYQGIATKLSNCEGTFCTLSQFLTNIKPFLFGNYTKECQPM